jgi:hypothetical protein
LIWETKRREKSRSIVDHAAADRALSYQSAVTDLEADLTRYTFVPYIVEYSKVAIIGVRWGENVTEEKIRSGSAEVVTQSFAIFCLNRGVKLLPYALAVVKVSDL